MGSYVYSLRKKHVEALLEGIYPIDVVSLEYAYKESYYHPGDYGYASYNRLQATIASHASRAHNHYMQRALDEFGTTKRYFFFAVGGLTDGTTVFRAFNWLPTCTWDNLSGGGLGDLSEVGRLYKIKRGEWAVSTQCPAHRWFEMASLPNRTIIQQCERCDVTRELMESQQ